MKARSLWVGLSSLGLCLAVGAPSTAAPCAPDGQRLATLSVTAGEAATELAIAWAPDIAADTHKLVESRRVMGACAGSVEAFAVSVGALEGGEGFNFDPKGVIKPQDTGDLLKPAPLEAPPPGGPGRFLMATRVEGHATPDGVITHYLGLWRHADRWTVASFSQRGSLNIGTVKPILTSTLPVAGVVYFPAADTASGQIALTLRDTSRTTSLLAFSWYHPKWFA